MTVAESEDTVVYSGEVDVSAGFQRSHISRPFWGNSPCPAVDVQNTTLVSWGKSSTGKSSIARI